MARAEGRPDGIWGKEGMHVKRLIIPCSPTPISPTLDQKVVFRLLIKRLLCMHGHQSDVKLHLEVGLSLKMYLAHVNVTSCAITGFVCTNSCS